MAKFVCYDKDDDALKVLYQWDRMRKIAIYDLDVWDGATLYFDFTNTNHISPITVIPKLEVRDSNGWHEVTAQTNDVEEEEQEEEEEQAEEDPVLEQRYTAVIPNEILEIAKPIILLVYQTTESNENVTIAELKITVLPRPKPGDSSYTPTDQVVKIPDGLELDGDMLYITSDGERVGDGVDIGGGHSYNPTIPTDANTVYFYVAGAFTGVCETGLTYSAPEVIPTE